MYAIAFFNRLSRKYLKPTRLFPLVALLTLEVASGAQICSPGRIAATSPTTQFELRDDGTAIDRRSGLMWMRCTTGQTWNGHTCLGEPTPYIWEDAFFVADDLNRHGGFAGKSDWRLATISELGSITEQQCADPAVNLEVFPNAMTRPVPCGWTSTPVADNPSQAWYVKWTQGSYSYYSKLDARQVRLVRNAR